MTRIALLADIHGNLPALEAVLADLAQFQVDQIVVAGDAVGRGPFTVEVLERVTKAGWPLIRGNHELYLLDFDTPRAPDSWRSHTMTPWLRNQVGSRWLNTMACWPDTLCLRFPDAPSLRIFHGTPQSAFSGIFHSDSDAKVSKLLADVAEDTVVLAHTHLPLDRIVDRWHILNPGSIGLPLDGLQMAAYMLLDGDADGWRATLRRVPINNTALYDLFERIGVTKAWGVTGRIVLHEFETARPQFTPAIRWHAAYHPDIPWSDELFDEYTRANHWVYQPVGYHVNVGQPRYELEDRRRGTIELRRATPEEAPTVVDILNEAAQRMVDRGINQWEPNSFSTYTVAESIERGEVYIAYQNGISVGTITVQWHDPALWGQRPLDAVYVHKLAVRRSAAGQNLGVRLLCWAETLAAEVGKSFVRLDCAAHNDALRLYYQRAGFVDKGSVTNEQWLAQLFERRVETP